MLFCALESFRIVNNQGNINGGIPWKGYVKCMFVYIKASLFWYSQDKTLVEKYNEINLREVHFVPERECIVVSTIVLKGW